MARAYRKKPVVVEAVQWTGENHAEMCEFIDPEAFEIIPRIGLVIHTLEGDHHASPGDYIIKGVNGEFYPCKPDIFAKTYESSTLAQPNEPLTLDELREMDGEPVWVEEVEHWALIDIKKGGQWDGTPFAVWKENWAEFTYNIKYRKLHCYRRPPEGEEETP